MNTRTTSLLLLVGVVLFPYPALGETQELAAYFHCDNADARAQWSPPDPPNLYAQGRNLWVKVRYIMNDHDLVTSYKYKLKFSGGIDDGEQSAERTTPIGYDDPITQYLFRELETGGDRYWKEFGLTIHAEVRNPSNNNLIDWDDDEVRFRLHDES